MKCCSCDKPATHSFFCWRHYVEYSLDRESENSDSRNIGLTETKEEEQDWRETVLKFRPDYRMRVDPDRGWRVLPKPRHRKRFRRPAANNWREQEEMIANVELRLAVHVAVDSMPNRLREIIRIRYGFGHGHEATIEDIADEFNLSRERVRQLEHKALRYLRHPMRSKALRDHLQLTPRP
jgi:RNA polymerase sigma factor (sigma-70 family)